MRLRNLYALTAAVLLCLSAETAAQVMRERPGVKAPPSAGNVTPACAADDKVEVTEFLVSKTQLREGDTVSVSMWIRNKCPEGTRPLSIEWDISGGSEKLAGGTEQLEPGKSKSFSATWKPAAGTYQVFGGVANHLNEAVGQSRQNNNREADVRVIRYVTRWLEPLKAKAAGATFEAPYSRNPNGQCTVAMSGLDPNTQVGAADELVMRLTCAPNTESDRSYAPHCVIFRAYQYPWALKNGWRVKTSNLVKKQAGYSHPSEPAPYPDFPREGDRGAGVIVQGCAHRPTQTNFEWVYKVQVEGPEGTDPYQ